MVNIIILLLLAIIFFYESHSKNIITVYDFKYFNTKNMFPLYYEIVDNMLSDIKQTESQIFIRTA